MATEIQTKGSTYITVAASQTTQVLTGVSAGKAGDYLARLIYIPATTAAGIVTLFDGSTSISIFVGGGTTALIDLAPHVVEIGAFSQTGAWKVTTGANISVIAVGSFS